MLSAMPFNHDAMLRRRTLLGVSQANLAIMSGVTLTRISQLERGISPNEGGYTGIDVAMRIAEALQMDINDLLISPAGNRYETAVRYAAENHAEMAGRPEWQPWRAPPSKRIKTRRMRQLAGLPTSPPRSKREPEPEPEPEEPPAFTFGGGMTLKEWVADQRAKRAIAMRFPDTGVIEDPPLDEQDEDGYMLDPSSE